MSDLLMIELLSHRGRATLTWRRDPALRIHEIILRVNDEEFLTQSERSIA